MWLKNFFRSKRKAEHAVIISFNYGTTDLEELHCLEDKLEELLSDKNVGDLDGHEIAMDGSDGFLYLYGFNAEDLFKTIKPVLLETSWMEGAGIHLRFGDVNDDNAKRLDFILQ